MRIKSVAFPLYLFAGCLFVLGAYSQDKNKNKFGKVEPKDFEKTTFELDTSAHAVVLADVGTSEFEMERDHFEIHFKRSRRVKIIDRNGYDAAKIEIPLMKSGQSEERLISLKAVAYNLEEGKVIDTKMDSKDVFTDQLSKNYIEKKFTLPAVKEGTIIEYTYTVSSPFYFNLQSWAFQGEYPCLWSEYTVTIPEFYDFIVLRQGYQSFLLNGQKSYDKKTFNMSYSSGGGAGRTEYASYTASTTSTHWTTKDVPAIKEEGFTTTLRNHVSKVEFQLASKKFPDTPIEPVMSTWPKLYEDLIKDEDFGLTLEKNNGYLGDVVDGLIAGVSSDTAKAKRIYNYVRQNYACTSHSGLYLSKPLKTVFSSHNGNETDINLLLVAMLRRAKLQAAPVILSTRQHGLTFEMYPLISRFNYTVASVTTGSGTYFLDASYAYLGFGRLDGSCYNGHARLMIPEMPAISFDADSLIENKSTFVMLIGENGLLKGHYEQKPTYFESCRLRAKVKDKGLTEYFKPMSNAFGMEATLSNTAIADLDDYEIPVKVSYDFEIKPETDGMLYINPMFSEANHSNPFKSQHRFYPVEMPYVMDELYTMNMIVPDGFEVDEMPKPAIIKFNETDGVYQYLIQKQDNIIQLRSRLILAKATFLPDEYNSLREFFDMIVKKQAEQIVLKKK